MATILVLNSNISFKRGTTVKNDNYTGPAGTISIDTDKNEIRIHNGTTAGGVLANSNPVTINSNGLMLSSDKVKLDNLIQSPTGGGTNKVFYEEDNIITDNYTLTSGKNAMSTGPVTINTGIVVEIPTGTVWTII